MQLKVKAHLLNNILDEGCSSCPICIPGLSDESQGYVDEQYGTCGGYVSNFRGRGGGNFTFPLLVYSRRYKHGLELATWLTWSVVSGGVIPSLSLDSGADL